MLKRKRLSSVPEAAKGTTEDSSSFTWKIQNFSKLRTNNLCSDTFTAGDHKWNISIYPKGNPTGKSPDHLSIYLNVADAARLADGWTKHVNYSLSLINQVDECMHVKFESERTFNASQSGWGFPSFIPLLKLRDGYVVQDTCIVKAEVLCGEIRKDQELHRNEEEKAGLNRDRKAEESSSSAVGEFDALLSDIQNVLESNASDVAKAPTTFMPFQLTDEDIVRAKRTLRECSNMKIATIFQSGRASELKNSLTTTLIANAFSNKAVLEMANFLTEFDLYLAVRRDLQEADEKESSVYELKAGMKRYFLELAPMKSRVNDVDREAADIERQLAERNAKKARVGDGLKESTAIYSEYLERQLAERNEEKVRLKNSLEDLAQRVTAARKALIDATEEMRLLGEKKERAKELSDNIERLWESLNKD